jgi:hypothetical protein
MVVLTNCKCQIKQAAAVTTITTMKIKHLSVQVRVVKIISILKDTLDKENRAYVEAIFKGKVAE